MWRFLFFSLVFCLNALSSFVHGSDLDDFRANRIIVWFVDNTNPLPGNGTLKNPFNNLLAAQEVSAPGDFIVVFPGDRTTRGMDTGIVLKDNQKLLGASQFFDERVIDVSDNPLLAGLQYPVITNLEGFGVVLANNNTVSGIHFDNTASFAIEGFEIANARIINNLITRPQTFGGINLFEVSGRIQIQDNAILLGAPGSIAGISYELTNGSTSHLDIIDNTIQGYPIGISIFVIGPLTKVDAKLDRNDVSGSTLSAVLIEANTQGQLRLAFTNNRIHDNIESNIFSGAVVVFSTDGALIRGLFADNRIFNNAEQGLLLSANLGGIFRANVFGNVFTRNAGFGFNASTDDLTDSFGPSSMCLSLTLNKSDNGFLLTNGIGSIFNLEPPLGNKGPIVEVGVITPVPAGFCE